MSYLSITNNYSSNNLSPSPNYTHTACLLYLLNIYGTSILLSISRTTNLAQAMWCFAWAVAASTLYTPCLQSSPLHGYFPSSLHDMILPHHCLNTSWFQDKFEVLMLAHKVPRIQSLFISSFTSCQWPLIIVSLSHKPCDFFPEHLCFCYFSPPGTSTSSLNPHLLFKIHLTSCLSPHTRLGPTPIHSH